MAYDSKIPNNLMATNFREGGQFIDSSEVANLPTEGVNAGAWAYCVDTGDTYMFNAKTNQWVLQ